MVGPFPDQAAAITAREQLATNAWHGYIRPWPVTSDSNTPGLGEPSGKAQSPAHERAGYSDMDDKDRLIAAAPLADPDPNGDVLIIEDNATGSEQDILIIEEEGEGDGLIILDEPTNETVEGPAVDIETDPYAADLS